MVAGRYIAVEGPLGVGKRPFAEKLATHLRARLVIGPKDNPFLPEFYAKGQQNRFQTQTYFLLARYQAQVEIAQSDFFFAGGVVSDFLFARDSLYAKMLLSHDEHALYDKVFALLHPRVTRPDLVVFLDARAETLLARMDRRQGASGLTRNLTLEYVEQVVSAYREFFFHWDHSPLLVVDTSDVDLESDTHVVDELLAVIGKQPHAVQHYIPLGSE